jgi:hypothetical protein
VAETSSKAPRNLPEEYAPPHSAEELLRRYSDGERFFPDADIPDNSSLRGAILAGAIFQDFWLSCVDLRDADLRGCRFENGNVKCSDFGNADLRNAVFAGAVHVEASSWHGAKVEGADFSGVWAYGSPINYPEFPFGKFGGSV